MSEVVGFDNVIDNENLEQLDGPDLAIHGKIHLIQT